MLECLTLLSLMSSIVKGTRLPVSASSMQSLQEPNASLAAVCSVALPRLHQLCSHLLSLVPMIVHLLLPCAPRVIAHASCTDHDMSRCCHVHA